MRRKSFAHIRDRWLRALAPSIKTKDARDRFRTVVRLGGKGMVPALAVAAIAAPSALAGSPSATKSLGEQDGIEFLRTKSPSVVSQAGAQTLCTGSDQVTGGGAGIVGDGSKSHLNTSGPIAGDQGWLAEGRSKSPKTVTTWAMCGAGAVATTSSTDQFEKIEQYNTGFTCAAGEALSGGIQGTGGNVLLFGMFPSEGVFDWTDSYGNASSSEASVRSTMICSSAYAFTRRTQTAVAKDREAPRVVAKCVEGETVIGGGVQVLKDGIIQSDVRALQTRPWDSKRDANKRPDDGWMVSSQNRTGTKVDVHAIATCLT